MNRSEELIQKALQRLCGLWQCHLSDLRTVKGDDRVLVYKKNHPWMLETWPALPQASIRPDELSNDLVDVTLLDDLDKVTYRREYVTLV